MTAVPFEHHDPAEEVRSAAREHALAVLRGRIGIIRSLSAVALRDVGTVVTSEQIGIPGSRAAED